MFAIYKKELRSYFTSFIGYVYLTIFALTIGFNFIQNNVMGGSGAFSYSLHSSTMIFLVLVPVLTMRLFADEKKHKTDQLLYTSPISVSNVVFGKFFAAVTLFIIGMIIISYYPIYIYLKRALPVDETLGSIIGYIFLISSFISIGLFISSLTENQVIAAAGTFGAMFAIYMADIIATSLPKDKFSSLMFLLFIALTIGLLLYLNIKNIYASIIVVIILCIGIFTAYYLRQIIFEELLFKIVSWFSLLSRFQNFTVGLLSLADIVYYITFSLAFLSLTIFNIEKQRWN